MNYKFAKLKKECIKEIKKTTTITNIRKGGKENIYIRGGVQDRT